MTNARHLAQFNVARIRYPLDDPRMAEFVDNVARVNALAEQIEGFVWRLQDASGHAMNMTVYGDPTILPNLTVWENAQGLERFVWQTVHGPVIGYATAGGARVALQGFGNVGAVAAELFAEAGAKIAAAPDSRGAIFNGKGVGVAGRAGTARGRGRAAPFPARLDVALPPGPWHITETFTTFASIHSDGAALRIETGGQDFAAAVIHCKRAGA